MRACGRIARYAALWAARFLIYGAGFASFLLLLRPALERSAGLAAGGLVAATSIVADLWLTARLGRATVAEVATRRLWWLGTVLGDASADGGQTSRPVGPAPLAGPRAALGAGDVVEGRVAESQEGGEARQRAAARS